MSTRALYTIIDADTKARPATQTRYGLQPAVKASKGDAWNLYIHGDGYPTGAADYVTAALGYAWNLPRFEADEFAAALCAAAKSYIPDQKKQYGEGGGNARFMPQGKPLAVASRHCADIQYRYEIRATGIKAYSVDAWEGKGKEHLLFKCSFAEFKATAKTWENPALLTVPTPRANKWADNPTS
jgi:hypothetical protein